MNLIHHVALPFAMVVALTTAHAESLRCNGLSTAEGDSKLSVLYKCGQPLMADSFCAPVYYPGALYPVPASIAEAYVPCQPVEDWLYDRGPGNLMATVRFRGGRVESIRYGRLPS
jgi:hypothetical protein